MASAGGEDYWVAKYSSTTSYNNSGDTRWAGKNLMIDPSGNITFGGKPPSGEYSFVTVDDALNILSNKRVPFSTNTYVQVGWGPGLSDGEAFLYFDSGADRVHTHFNSLNTSSPGVESNYSYYATSSSFNYFGPTYIDANNVHYSIWDYGGKPYVTKYDQSNSSNNWTSAPFSGSNSAYGWDQYQYNRAVGIFKNSSGEVVAFGNNRLAFFNDSTGALLKVWGFSRNPTWMTGFDITSDGDDLFIIHTFYDSLNSNSARNGYRDVVSKVDVSSSSSVSLTWSTAATNNNNKTTDEFEVAQVTANPDGSCTVLGQWRGFYNNNNYQAGNLYLMRYSGNGAPSSQKKLTMTDEARGSYDGRPQYFIQKGNHPPQIANGRKDTALYFNFNYYDSYSASSSTMQNVLLKLPTDWWTSIPNGTYGNLNIANGSLYTTNCYYGSCNVYLATQSISDVTSSYVNNVFGSSTNGGLPTIVTRSSWTPTFNNGPSTSNFSNSYISNF